MVRRPTYLLNYGTIMPTIPVVGSK